MSEAVGGAVKVALAQLGSVSLHVSDHFLSLSLRLLESHVELSSKLLKQLLSLNSDLFPIGSVRDSSGDFVLVVLTTVTSQLSVLVVKVTVFAEAIKAPKLIPLLFIEVALVGVTDRSCGLNFAITDGNSTPMEGLLHILESVFGYPEAGLDTVHVASGILFFKLDNGVLGGGLVNGGSHRAFVHDLLESLQVLADISVGDFNVVFKILSNLSIESVEVVVDLVQFVLLTDLFSGHADGLEHGDVLRDLLSLSDLLLNLLG